MTEERRERTPEELLAEEQTGIDARETQPQPPEAREGETIEAREGEAIEELPQRDNMSLINANLAIPINAAIAANVLSDDALAAASAEQNDPITQGILSKPPIETDAA